jgi:replication factor C subunit 2/4
MPHLLFYGPPGSGKSSTIKALCNELYGTQTKDYVLHLNASDERGISIVRDKIKNFAQFGSTTKKNGIPFKIIILDEADNITDDAQTALRRTMEIYSRATRFCLICNHITNINHPLRSRCAIFRFKPLLNVNVVNHIATILQRENIIIDNNVNANELIKELVTINNGDFRKILIQLEALMKLYTNEKITLKHIYENARIIPHDYITDLINEYNFEQFIIILNDILLKGYSGIQLLYQIFDYILFNDSFSDQFKTDIVNEITLCEERMNNGSDELIQLTRLFSKIQTKNE